MCRVPRQDEYEQIVNSVMSNKAPALKDAIAATSDQFGIPEEFVWSIYTQEVHERLNSEYDICDDSEFYEPDGDVMSFEDSDDVVAHGEVRLRAEYY